MAITVNGKGDKATIKALQEMLKSLGYKDVTVDGVIGGQNKDFIKKYAPSLTAVKYGKNGSRTVSALQKWSGVSKPYDGVWGVNTSKALMKKLKALGYASGSPHGCFNENWMRALQRCINNGGKAKPQPTPPTPPSGQPYTGEYPIVNRSKSLIDMAVKLAWTKGTAEKKYRYPSGSATSAFKTALKKVYPNHNSWGKAPSVGASCDVFVGTVVRYAGLDSKYPRGLEEQFEYKPSLFDRYVYKNTAPYGKSQDGDIVMFDYEGNGAHTVIRGSGYYYEANYSTYFGHTNTSLSRLKSKYPLIVILRPRNYLKKGDSGAEVKKLQKYLIWYGALPQDETVDGVFGQKTHNATVKLQKDLGMSDPDGTVGVKTIAKMKEVRK